MVKFEIVNGELKDCRFIGSISDISADLMCVVNVFYRHIKEESSDAAERLKAVWKSAVLDGTLFLNDDEIAEQANNKKEELTDIEKTLKKILDMFKGEKE